MKNYIAKKQEVEALNLTVEKKAAEIKQVEKSIAATISLINDLNARLITANKEKIFGRTSTEAVLSLKAELSEQQTILDASNEELIPLAEELNLLQADLINLRRSAAGLRKQLTNELIKTCINDIPSDAIEPFKKLTFALLASKSNNENPDDIYQVIGVEVCKKLFGEQSQFKAKLPSIVESKQKIDEMIDEAA